MSYAIIGAGGRQVDPADYEADTIIGGLESMDDDTIIGQAANLTTRFPRLMPRAQQTSPRIANLLSAARALGPNLRTMLGTAGPRVAQAEPGPVGLALVPFNSAAAVPAGGTATIVVQPQSIFKPYKLVVDSVIRPFFLIQSFQIGTTPLFDAPGAVAATMFLPDALPNLKKITANPGISVTMTVSNRDGAPHPFFAAVYGEAAPTQCG